MLMSRRELTAALPDDAARTWLAAALAEALAAAAEGAAAAHAPWELRYAAAGRHCGPEPDHVDSARVLLLIEAHAGPDTVTRLYRQGTGAERRAALLALPYLDALTPPAVALPLVEDALRTNDGRLVAAAVGPYAAAHLDAHAWRHAVLKCLFTGVPLDAVDSLVRRARGDGELARMLRDYAAERTAAHRTVPDDLHRVLALTAEPSPRFEEV
ncbi:EboA domain-containing protein [Streptomyces sp. NPDC017979]|uniref:EboA domain-containing protein n=1 Tax=Streptomyces sp. NPDC017979 TaxID=3365024 RepID=UPI00378BE398